VKNKNAFKEDSIDLHKFEEKLTWYKEDTKKNDLKMKSKYSKPN